MAALREVMTHINEDKRKAEGQVTLFNIFNDIDNCPVSVLIKRRRIFCWHNMLQPDIVSSHRSYVARAEVIQLSSSEGLASKGSNLVMFIFSDQLEVCKKKSKAFNSMKSPSASSFQMQGRPNVKPYKHVRMMALNTIKRVSFFCYPLVCVLLMGFLTGDWYQGNRGLPEGVQPGLQKQRGEQREAVFIRDGRRGSRQDWVLESAYQDDG